jgi:hypothetical protein
MLATTVMLATALLLSCRGGAPAGGGELRRYTVRGEIVQLPSADRPGSEMMVRHEAIDDFVDRSGQVVGMDSMVMPFRVEPAVSLQGLAVGDPIALRFAMDWEKPSLRVEKVERLPSGTALRFGPARRPPSQPPRP